MGCRKILRAAIVIAVILFAAAQVSALKIATDKKAYVKGETVSIEGLCAEGKNTLYAVQGRAVVFGREVACKGAEYFKTTYETGYLDPSGQWVFTIEGGGGRAEARAFVAQAHESAYFVIGFLSPPAGPYARAEDVTISVKVTDSGAAVADAAVFTWDANGGKAALKNRGNGIYQLDYTIPYDAAEGRWSIVVVAERGSGTEKRGGEAVQELSIGKAVLNIDVIEPEARSFSLGSEIPLRVRVGYTNGRAVDAASGLLVYASLKGRGTALLPDGNGNYYGTLKTSGGDEADQVAVSSPGLGATGTRCLSWNAAGLQAPSGAGKYLPFSASFGGDII